MSPIPPQDILKYSGFAIAAGATIWGLCFKVTFEDEHKNKRLTAAGHVAVAIAICGALVSALSFGIESQAHSIAQAREDELTTQRELSRRTDAAEARADAADLRASTEAAAAKAREDAANARADAAEQRDLLRKGTAANLARTQRALIDIDRSIHPLWPIEVGIAWRIQTNTPGMEFFDKKLSELKIITPDELSLRGNSSVQFRNDKLQYMTSKEGSTYYPNESSDASEFRARSLLVNSTATLLIYGERLASLLRTKIAQHRSDIEYIDMENTGADLIFALGASSGDIVYDVNGEIVSVRAAVTQDRHQTAQTGEVVSVPDLEHSIAVIYIRSFYVPYNSISRMPYIPVKLNNLLIKTSGEQYRLTEKNFKRFQAKDGDSILVSINPIGHPLREPDRSR
jgi:hypothetical protein